MLEGLLRECQARVDGFASEAHSILATSGSSPSRVVNLAVIRRGIAGLTIKQAGLLDEAIRCIQARAFLSAHVAAWAAYADLLEECIAADGMLQLHAIRPGWTKFSTLDELRENVAEYQLVDAAHALTILSKSEAKSVHGLLAKRNECAHPSGRFVPGLNEALGYLSEVIGRIQSLQSAD